MLVTEPHAELNAGFVGLFASKHPAIFNWVQWNEETKYLNAREFEERCSQAAGILTSAYWTLVSQYLCRRLSPYELSPEDSKAWIQTGLALSPLFGTVAQHSIDVIIVWALIGEWSSRVPPPEGQWPRHGHPQCILELYVQRAPSLTAWAELASSKELLRPSYTYLELCQYLPCPETECSKVQVSTPMCSDQLSFTHMGERKCTWNLPFRHCGCKVGYRWLLRWWELTRDQEKTKKDKKKLALLVRHLMDQLPAPGRHYTTASARCGCLIYDVQVERKLQYLGWNQLELTIPFTFQ